MSCLSGKRFGSKIPKNIFLFLVGGFGYVGIEILFRGYSHPSMFVLGGLCFLLCGLINEYVDWSLPLISQQFIAMMIITVLEFITGCIVNIWLKLDVWDYSNLPYNLCGQICLIFTIAWFFLSIVGIVLDDFLRWKFYGEEVPRYSIFGYRPNAAMKRFLSCMNRFLTL